MCCVSLIKPQEGEWQELLKKYAPREQRPKRSKKRERKHQVTIEQLPVSTVKPFTRKVAAEQFPLSRRTSATALKRPTLASHAAGRWWGHDIVLLIGLVILPSMHINHAGEALKQPTVPHKYGAPLEVISPAKYPLSVMVCKN